MSNITIGACLFVAGIITLFTSYLLLGIACAAVLIYTASQVV
jgi:hypothetical protein